MTWSIERTVAVLTPFFAALAGAATGWLARHFPGVSIPADQLVAIEIAGFTGATAAALKWLHGRAQFISLEKSADAVEAKIRAEIAASPQAALAISDVENLLHTHRADIENAIDQHVPAAVAQAIQALFSQLGHLQSAAASPPPPVQPVG